MATKNLVETLSGLVRVGKANDRPWAIVRFKDIWDAGLGNVRRDKLENALNEVLKSAGINIDLDPQTDEVGYVTFISAKGLTIYVGRTEITDWIDTDSMFSDIKPIIEAN